MIHPLLFKVSRQQPLDRPLSVDWGTRDMESNARYYSRRAVEERMKAQRAITEAARTWHAKLAHDFAERAIECSASCNAATPAAATAATAVTA
jgi:hypothetical protein